MKRPESATDTEGSEELYRLLFEHAPIGIVMTDARTLRMKRANRAFSRMLGYREGELIGLNVADITAPEDMAITLAVRRGVVAGESQSYQIEKRYIKKDGEFFWASVTTALVADGQENAVTIMAMVEDISERKQAAAQRLAQAEAQRHTLIREVHHRIKNNLQSVAGLLGRELGGHAELHPRLAVAISQVNAIATVHGLQSAGSNETIRLCDTLEQICTAIAEQTRQPVHWRLAEQSQAFLPVHIAEDEAVAVALVLNELVFNAVKHTPPEAFDPAVSVSMMSDGAVTRVSIGNAAAPGSDFDLASGRGLNTGLKLLRSLLPGEGAVLNYRGIGTDRVVADLALTAPVVALPVARRPA